MKASENRNSSRMNRERLHNVAETQSEEKWKMSPSTEVTSDRGENARVARERKVDENAPRNRIRGRRK
jgi:hypothetical protein